MSETRTQTYKRLAGIAGGVGVDEEGVFALLEIKEGEGRNVGNAVTGDVKVQVRANRLVGVHVTPVSDVFSFLLGWWSVLTVLQTVVFDGLVNNDISSSWTVEQWEEWLAKNVV